jgi:hypothetical protein
MPLASWASLHFNGPAAGAMVTSASATVTGTASGYAKAQHVGGGDGSMPRAQATRLVSSLTVINGAATTTYLPMKANIRAGAIIKVNELSQDDVTGAVLEAIVEPGLTLRQALRLVAAATAGKISGGGTSTVTIRNAVADGADRIVATVDSAGNRTAITYDLT